MEKASTKQPLVSIYVITYNSSKTVVETLGSIKAQTYQNIELVVSDDHSPDNTVEVCEEWIKENRKRFASTEIVTSKVNTGITENTRRGRLHCHGEWKKCIAGDDLLIPSAIEEYMSFFLNNPNARICVSNLEVFSDEVEVPMNIIKSYEHYFNMVNQPFKEQWLHCLQENIFVGPGVMSHKDLKNELIGITGDWGNADEWPFFYRVLKSGHQIYAIKKKLIRYRYSNASISHVRTKTGLRNKGLELSTCKFFFQYPYKDLLREHHYLIAWDRYLYYKTRQMYYEKDGATWTAFLMKCNRYLSPYVYLKRIKRLFKK